MSKVTMLLCALFMCLGHRSGEAQNMGETATKPAVKPRYPFQPQDAANRDKYVEPVLPGADSAAVPWDKVENGLHSAFASSDVRFGRHEAPSLQKSGDSSNWQTKSWIGQKSSKQLLLWSKIKVGNISVVTGDLRSQNGFLLKGSIKTGLVRYVLSDATAGACDMEGKDLTPVLVGDMIEAGDGTELAARTVQPVWVTLDIPQTARPGLYSGRIQVFVNGASKPVAIHRIEVEVTKRKLPAASERSYHLDLWQHPFKVSDFYGVKPWSPEHFAKLRSSMQMLRDAGQKVITTSVLWDQFNGQSRGIENAFIQPIKKSDGTWSYDYSNFDKWVEFMLRLGIDKQINCYGPAPWVNQFFYYDEASKAEAVLKAEPGSEAYAAYWLPLLTDFRDHLKRKGWFSRTALAIDERPLPATEAAVKLIKQVDADFKIAYSGKFHASLEPDIYDYSLTLKTMPEETKAERKRLGKVTTFYTCCWEVSPNTFTLSAPADAAWLSWFSAANDFDGYLRWAYDAWDAHSLNDSRNTQVAAGDSYLVYPGGRSSVRFEKLIEGIQDYEKITILRSEYSRIADKQGAETLNSLLTGFRQFGNIPTTSGEAVRNARLRLDAL